MKHAALALAFALALPALAGELDGVQMPDTIDVAGKQLKLNGMGLRTKFFVAKVYVAGLYAETPSKDPAALINADEIKRVKMVMLRDLSRDQIAEAIREGFEKNNKAQLPQLKARLDNFIAQMPAAVKTGDVLELTYQPGKGTEVTAKSGQATQIEGKDFADALFSVWLGKFPVDESLKRGMLGNR